MFFPHIHYFHEFPFLIGRIRTDGTEIWKYTNYEFPFLIGRIRTRGSNLIYKRDSEFPFLIGRIRTLVT